MRTTKNLGMILLAIWLIITGVVTLFMTLNFLGILAIAAGVLILLDR